jgi:hypothetical protein
VTAPVRLNIVTRERGKPTGFDTAIITIPGRWYVDLGAERALVAGLAALELREISGQLAGSMGARLHHAQWTLTGDPELVKSLGAAHDCVTCRAGMDQALAYLRGHPDREVAVGHLWWA